MTDLTRLTLTEAQKGLRNKDFSSVELTQSFLKRMEENKDLNVYITETPEQALEQAKTSDQRLASGKGGGIRRFAPGY